MDRLAVVEQVISCTNCELHTQCTAPVPFRGEPSRIAVVGEAPGATEDEKGRPFIGPAGQLLGDVFAAAGIAEPMGVCNTVSCFPHGSPTLEQVTACADNKGAQIDYLDPTFVLVLGRVALQGMRRDLKIRHARARPFIISGRICFASYHPAAALRNGQYETVLREDMVRFKELVDAGPDRWMDFVPDTCAGCGVEPVWFEDNGLGWCELHLPSGQVASYKAHHAMLAAQMDGARHRARGRRDAAVAGVEANADDDWLADAFDALVAYLRTNPEFFSDDFWSVTQIRRPRESRAFGPVVMKAARDGLMEKSGEFRKSVASNMTEKPVWRSLIYGGSLPTAASA